MPDQTLTEQKVREIARQEAEAVTGVLRAELTDVIRRYYDDQRRVFDALDKYLRNLEVLVTVQTEKLGTQVSGLSAQLKAREDQVEKIEGALSKMEDRVDNQTVLLAQTTAQVRAIAADIDGDTQYPDRQPSLRKQIEMQQAVTDRHHHEMMDEIKTLFTATDMRIQSLEKWVTRRAQIEQTIVAGTRQVLGVLWTWRLRIVVAAIIIALLALLGIQISPEHLQWLK